MAAVSSEAPTLFLRKATGLVKGWNRFDAFVYSFLSVNLITLGLYGALSFAPFFPDGQVLPAVLITAVLTTAGPRQRLLWAVDPRVLFGP